MDRKEDSLEATVTKNNRLVMIDAPVLDDRKSERSNRKDDLGQREAALADLHDENER